MTACPTPRCAPTIKRDYFVSITGSAFGNITASDDCSIGIVLLTDDAGLIDVDDAPLGAFLEADNRVKLLTSASDVAKHYKPCTSTYDDLISFFRMPFGKGSRPRSIQVGFVDRSNGENLSDAYKEIIKCPVCAWQMVPTLYNTDGDPYVDTTELLDFQALVRADGNFDVKVPTFEASLYFSDPFETTSNAYLAAQTGSDAEYVVSSYYCDVERDANCDPILTAGETTPINKYSNDALLVAAIAASYSQYDNDYNWSEFLKPFDFGPTSTATGLFVNENTGEPISVTEPEIINATSINGYDGNFVPGATRAVNGFFRTQNGITYMESLRVNRKQFADIWFKERAVRDALQKEVLTFMGKRHSLGISSKEARLLAARISLVLQSFVRNNVINPAEYDWEANGYSNIVVDRPGYVITRKPISEITQAQISQRNGYSLGVCFLVNEPQHRVGLQLCEVAVLTSEVTG